jgi:predicted flap endonuclease-1-like 5' DNA nuclease
MPTGLDELPKIGAPATRALHNAGLTTLRQVADVPRNELAALHGMGPKALRILDEALAEHGLKLA